jgi:hypothetical protein
MWIQGRVLSMVIPPLFLHIILIPFYGILGHTSSIIFLFYLIFPSAALCRTKYSSQSSNSLCNAYYIAHRVHGSLLIDSHWTLGLLLTSCIIYYSLLTPIGL